ncbi:hypothetical protein ANCCEY_06678 [Ancylostoma ceylanicum]|uniref:SCP domain-containing protein n=1 Tax=Ancylostoma ceylanicum TaxID=53326 RepID=A0A0D6LQT0_9BILA|nr:hypothetical protein ANCCEY_06678 [Ancylostoma ceylanicum]
MVSLVQLLLFNAEAATSCTPLDQAMGWATSNLLGCSIVKCTTSDRYVGVCRYSPKGNLVNNNVYQVGTVCSACPTGKTSCNRDEGLCF